MADRIVYFEISDSEPERGARFYRDVFGWEATPSSTGYFMLQAGRGIEGGLAAQHSHGQPVLLYIGVSDIEATLAEVTARGGEAVIAKTLISPEYGSYAVFRDPGGVVMGLWAAS
jgi:uncharacterized protein